MDAYYVLSFIGQFKLPNEEDNEFLQALTYGLFRRTAIHMGALIPILRARRTDRWEGTAPPWEIPKPSGSGRSRGERSGAPPFPSP